ncbi:STAS domain-containing protein [Actinoplanes sp. HUAS TT8]|uniref:STAS domain-containing protein n=1 Tax=Actinoplanes sp. HUAS TT8 TaxID=3447453 RepID=UPI003F524ABE
MPDITIDEHGGAAVITIRGALDADAAPALREALAGAATSHRRVVVNLSGASHIDRIGLSVLIAAQDRANSDAVQLCFTAPSPALLAALCDLRAEDLLATLDPDLSRPAPPALRPAGFSLPGRAAVGSPG